MTAKGVKSSPDPYCDSHVHTRFCGHASGEMEEYVRAAIRQGLKKIVFLEHMEEGIESSYKTWLSEEDFDLYFTEGDRLRKLYGSRIEIGLGVECGYNPMCADTLRSRLAKRRWDRIGISCHYLTLEGVAQHLNMFSRQAGHVELACRFDPELLLDRYFRALHQAVRQLPGTFVCHLDAALRHVPGAVLKAGHYQAIDELLQAIKDQGMAIEVNASGIPIRGEPFPNRRILSMVRDYGIPLVLGSDAHKPAEVARHFSEISRFIP